MVFMSYTFISFILFLVRSELFFFIMNLRIPLFNIKKSYYYFIKILYFIIIIQNSYIYIILIILIYNMNYNKSTFILIIFLKIVLSSHL